MGIYEYALQMEKDGEAYYRNLALKTGNAGLKNIINILADAEVKHYDVLQKMKRKEKVHMVDVDILTNVKNVFIKMKEEKDTLDVEVSQTELYKKAQEIEIMSKNFYLEKADDISDQLQKDVFLRIAEEEKKHYFILENIIDFISRPYNWLEDAEWYHLDEY